MSAIVRKIVSVFLRRLSQLWNWLITPANPPRQTDELHRARLLSAMLLLVIVLGVLIEGLTRLSDASFNTVMNRETVLSTLSLLAAYLFNRLGYYRPAAWVSVIVLVATIFLMTFYTGGLAVDASFLSFLFIPLLFASVFLAERSILWLTGLCLAAMTLAGMVYQMDLADILLGPGSFVAMAGGTIFLMMRHRNLMEAERQRDLVKSEERYRMLFEGANDAIFLLDLASKHIAANQKAASMLGYEVDELVGKPASQVVAQREYLDTLAVQQTLLAGQAVPTYERIMVRKDGTEFPVEVSVSLLRGGDGQPEYIQSIVRDISERKQAEARLHTQLDRQNALREIDLMITTSPDLQVTLQFLLHHATTLLGMTAADILLFKPGLNHLELFASHGYFPHLARHSLVQMDDPLTGRAASEQRLVSLPDLAAVQAGSPHLQALVRQGFAAAFGVPLLVKDQVKGVLEVFHNRPFEPAPDWLDFLEMLGGQAAIAIDSAELFQNLQRSNQELLQSYEATLKGWALALELRDKETRGHSDRVTEMTLRLGQALGLDDASLLHLRRGAWLHDIGKMGIPDEILYKPGALTDEDWAVMKKHPVYAAEMLASIPFLQQAIDIPFYHHERWNGSGYPLGLKGKSIPLAARIFMVVDIWDALVSDRPYRKAWTNEQALQYLRDQAGVQLDPEIVPVFLKLVEADAG